MFKLDGLENPKPFKMWERTKYWTLEDTSLFGGATGLLIASNPRLFPGITGISRFVGAALAGCAVSAKTIQWVLNRGPPHQAQRIEQELAMQRRAHYQRISMDEKAKESLSRFGKGLLISYTSESQFMRILNTPFGGQSGTANPGSSPVTGHDTLYDEVHTMDMRLTGFQQAHAKQTIQLGADFDKDELAAPDYDNGYRQYNMDAADTDVKALKDYLEYLDVLHAEEAKALSFLWQELAPKEHEMHQLAQNDPEKDIVRRQLQFLNSIAIQANIRLAAIGYAQADTRKRLAQIRNDGPSAILKIPSPGASESPDEISNEDRVLQKITMRIRDRWVYTRALVVEADHVLSQVDGMKAKGLLDSDNIELIERFREENVQLRRNVIATERLLKDLEDRSSKADGGNGR